MFFLKKKKKKRVVSKCAAKEEMRVAERKAATLLHSQGFKHSTNNGSKARSWAWLLCKEKILEVVGRKVNVTSCY
jgi:hypothetical protein